MTDTAIRDTRRTLSVTSAASFGDRGTSVTPKSCFFLCNTMRSGSTLLCDALASTGVAGYAEEYFPESSSNGEVYLTTGAALKDPQTWQADWTNTPFEQCLERVLRSGTTPNGVFASKLRWFNLAHLGEMLGALPDRDGVSLPERLDELFPNLRYVWITRRDKVRQAVSLVKARQSRRWKAISPQSEGSDAADYSFWAIETAVRRIVHQECAWEEYFAHAEITPFTVVYEDLVRNYESTVRRLLDHLQIDLPQGYVFPAPRLHKQADGVSEEWVMRYHHDERSSRIWRAAAKLPGLFASRPLRQTYALPCLRARIVDPLLRQRKDRPQPAMALGRRSTIKRRFERI